jgi:hypothetical protein
MKLSHLIRLLERLCDNQGDNEICELKVAINESRTASVPLLDYANTIQILKAERDGKCLYFHHLTQPEAIAKAKLAILQHIEELARDYFPTTDRVVNEDNEYAFDLLIEDGLVEIDGTECKITPDGVRYLAEHTGTKNVVTDVCPFWE